MAEKKSKRNEDVKPELSWPFAPDELADDEGLLDLAMNDHTPPNDHEIAEQNQGMLRRQSEFRTAAECVARALSKFEEVQKIVLFGSVALPLK